MSEETAIVLSEIQTLSTNLSKSKVIPSTLQGKPADVLAIVLTGRELGIGPMTAMRGIDVIQGKVSMSSQLIGALILSSPACEYLTPVEATDKVATYETKRKGSPDKVRMSFTIEEAKTAGLAGKDNWKKNPTAMLLARAQSRIGRAVYPDKCLGVYDRDSGELDDLAGVKDVSQGSQAEHVAKVAAALKPTVEVTDAEFTVAPALPAESVTTPVVAEPIRQTLADRIAAAATLAELAALGGEIKALTKDEKIAIQPAYRARQTALTGGK